MTNSIREALQEALKESGAEIKEKPVLDDDSDDEVAPVQEESAESEAPSKSVERDANGKFLKAEQKDAKAEQVSNAEKQESTKAPEQGTTSGAPATFSKEEQAQWDNVPPLVKNAIQRVTTQSQTAVLQAKQELAETKRENAARDTVLEPYAKLWTQNGVPVQQGLAIAMKAVYDFERDPVNTLKRLAAQYGISIAEDGNDQYVDPADARLAQLEKKLTDFEQTQSQSTQNAIQQRNLEEATRFVETKDANGSLAHPYWEKVLPQMKALMPAVSQMNPGMYPQDVFKRAYDIACQQSEEVRTEIAANQTAQVQQGDFERRLATAQKAKQGVVSASPATAVGSENAIRKGMSVREHLQVALRENAGRM